MRYKVMTSGLVGFGMLAVVGMSFADTVPAKPSNPQLGAESKASPKQATGQVTFIEAKAGKLAVKTAEQELSLNVQASATRRMLESIKVGRQGQRFLSESGRDSSGRRCKQVRSDGKHRGF